MGDIDSRFYVAHFMGLLVGLLLFYIGLTPYAVLYRPFHGLNS